MESTVNDNERLIRVNRTPIKNVYNEDTNNSQTRQQITRITKTTTRQWTSNDNTLVSDNMSESRSYVQTPQPNYVNREHSYTPLFQRVESMHGDSNGGGGEVRRRIYRANNSHSKSPSPNFNTLHRKTQINRVASPSSVHSASSHQYPPRIKLNLSLAPNLRIRENEIRSSISPNGFRRASSVSSTVFSGANEYDSSNGIKRGTSPFTYIETTSIKKKSNKKRKLPAIATASPHYYNTFFSRDENFDQEQSKSVCSTPGRKEFHKTLVFTAVSPNGSRRNIKVII